MLKRILSIALVVVFIASMGASIGATYTYDDYGRLVEIVTDSGDRIIYVYDEAGNITSISVIAADAIEISTPEELNAIRKTLSGSYRLVNDIDLTGIAWVPAGTPAEPFSGTLDGNGFVIKNLNVHVPNTNNAGLFGRNSGTIIDLGLQDTTVTGQNNTGGIAGHNSGNILNCYVEGDSMIKGVNNTGGLAGINVGGILKSYFDGDVQGNDNVGGFAGSVSGGVFEQCYASANVKAAGANAGGFTGYMTDSVSVIRNCFSTGKVEGGSNSAGFIGTVNSGKIENCYSVSSNANGFSNQTGMINCYFDRNRISVPTSKAEARTTAQMMRKANYTGWDFDDIWDIDEDLSYPVLRELPKPGTSRYIADDAAWLTFDVIKGNNVAADDVMTDLILPSISKNGAFISWSSSDTSVISNTGTVNRPPYGTSDAVIELTATFHYAFISSGINLEITVIADDPVDAETPVISRHPQDITASVGEPETLTVAASVSKGLLSYQWFEKTANGDILISGAGQAFYIVPADVLGEKSYYCVITNTDNTATGVKAASATSLAATVTTVYNAEKPVISQQPANAAVLEDEAATLTVAASISSLGTLSYQWVEKTAGGDIPISGADQESYAPQTNIPGERAYYCIVTNTDNAATGHKTASVSSNAATVKVISRENAETPSIVQPVNISVLEGETATLTISANVFTGTLSYQWFERRTGGDTLIAGANQASYTAPTDTVGVKTYYCVVTNTNDAATGNTVTSVAGNVAAVTVIAILDADAPAVTGYSADFIVPVNGTAVLTITVSVPKGTLSYQWYEKKAGGDTPITGANQAFYIAQTDTLGERGYYCIVTNTDSTATGVKTASVTGGVVTVTVSKPSTFNSISLDVNGIHSFANAAEDYDAIEEKTILITNTGLNGVTGLNTVISGGDTDAFTVTQPLHKALSDDMTTTFTVTPNEDLPPKTYMSIVSVTGDNNVMISFIASFTVGGDPIYGPRPAPYPTPAPETGTEPDPAPEPKPDENKRSVEITINNRPVNAEAGSDGTLTIKITELYANGSGELTIDIKEKVDHIIAHILISALQNDDLVIHTDFGVIRMPNDMLFALGEVCGDLIIISLKRGSFIFGLLDEKGAEILHHDPKSPATLTLPYTLEEGRNPGAVVAVDKNGTIIPHAVYRDGWVTFNIAESGRYDVIYNKKTFTDISGHWSEGHIEFVTARSLYAGIGDGRFGPGGNMSRAMFIQVLANLEGIDASSYTSCRFTDVSDSAWYMAAAEWAAEKGITAGIGGGRFDPNAPITRQQMAVMLNSYIEYKGFAFTPTAVPAPFADEASISSWALDAVRTIQNLGLVSGTPGNLYDPGTVAKRSETAAIFAKLIALTAK